MLYTLEDPTKMIKASCFAFALFTTIILLLLMAFMNSGPIILGTEMNTNGAVEYLCLGSGCDDLRDFDW